MIMRRKKGYAAGLGEEIEQDQKEKVPLAGRQGFRYL